MVVVVDLALLKAPFVLEELDAWFLEKSGEFENVSAAGGRACTPALLLVEPEAEVDAEATPLLGGLALYAKCLMFWIVWAILAGLYHEFTASERKDARTSSLGLWSRRC